MFNILSHWENANRTTLRFHRTPVRTANTTTTIPQMMRNASMDVGREHIYSLLVGMKAIAMTIEISVDFNQVKSRPTI